MDIFLYNLHAKYVYTTSGQKNFISGNTLKVAQFRRKTTDLATQCHTFVQWKASLRTHYLALVLEVGKVASLCLKRCNMLSGISKLGLFLVCKLACEFGNQMGFVQVWEGVLSFYCRNVLYLTDKMTHFENVFSYKKHAHCVSAIPNQAM